MFTSIDTTSTKMASDLRGFQVRLYTRDRTLVEQAAIARDERLTAFIMGSTLSHCLAIDLGKRYPCVEPLHQWEFKGQYQESIEILSRKYSKSYLVNLAIERLLMSHFPVQGDTVNFKEVRHPGRVRPLTKRRFGRSKNKVLRSGRVVAQTLYMKVESADFRHIDRMAKLVNSTASTLCREASLEYAQLPKNAVLTEKEWIEELEDIAKHNQISFDELIQAAVNRLAVDIAKGVQIFPHVKVKQEVC